jgi:nucleoside-diphosphate-sugar epimerase
MQASATALIVGATGAAASRLTELLAARADWQVIALCRRPPADGPDRVQYLAPNLLAANACRERLATCSEVTNIFYAARAGHGEGGSEPVEDNLAMLRNVVEAIEPAAPGLRHVHLVEGGKWYGLHHGPYKTPAKEDDPRHPSPNFYYDQQDFLEARQRGKRWSWSASRPNVICDFAPGRARSLVTILGAYAAIRRELGLALDFPGKPGAYDTLTEVTEAGHLARAMLWMASEPSCANQAFNITNGDLFRWRNLWPRLAAWFEMPAGDVRPIRLAEWAADKAPVWERVVARHGLRPTPFAEIALWGFGDFVLGQDFDLVSDMTKARRFGFHDVVDSEAMLFDLLEQYRAARILP